MTRRGQCGCHLHNYNSYRTRTVTWYMKHVQLDCTCVKIPSYYISSTV